MKLLLFFAAGLVLSVGASACRGNTAVPAETPSGAASAEPAAAAGSMTKIDVAALAERLADVPVLVDVRTPGEFGGGHVPGAINLPLQELDARMGELEAHKGGPVYVICQSGKRSNAAGKKLAAAGYTVVDVADGTGGWRAAGNAVE